MVTDGGVMVLSTRINKAQHMPGQLYFRKDVFTLSGTDE